MNKTRTTIWLRPSEHKALAKLTKKYNLSNSELLGRLIIKENATS